MSTSIDPQLLLAGATLLLVFVTAYYAYQTRRTVEMMKESTEAQFLPHLRLSLALPEGPILELVVTNVGKASAVGVEANFQIRELADSARQWTTPLLNAADSARFLIPVGKDKHEYTVDFFKAHQSTMDFQAKYSDIFGKSYSVSQSVDITAFVTQLDKTPMTYPRGDLDKVVEELRDIASELRARG